MNKWYQKLINKFIMICFVPNFLLNLTKNKKVVVDEISYSIPEIFGHFKISRSDAFGLKFLSSASKKSKST